MTLDIFNLINGSENSLIPSRDPSAVTGSVFCQNNMTNDRMDREKNILNELLNGNMPNFLRKFVPITITENGNTITYLVTSDVISIGSDDDYVRMCMQAPTAKILADKWDCSLITEKMSNQIWEKSEVKLQPTPYGPPFNEEMLSTSRMLWHNSAINQQLKNEDKTKLIASQGKDVVIDKVLLTKTDRICIVGWRYKDGKVIQDLNCSSHEKNYQDYSQYFRFVAQDVLINGQPARFYDILMDKKLSYLISDRGDFDGRKIYK